MFAVPKMTMMATVGFAANQGAPLHSVDQMDVFAERMLSREVEATMADASFVGMNATVSDNVEFWHCSNRRRAGPGCTAQVYPSFVDQEGEAFEAPLDFSGRRRYNTFANETETSGVSVAWTGRRILDCRGDAAKTLVCQGRALFWDAPHYALGTLTNTTCVAKCPAPGCEDQVPAECLEVLNLDMCPGSNLPGVPCFIQEEVDCNRLPNTSTLPVQCDPTIAAPIEEIWVSPFADQDAECSSFGPEDARPMKCVPKDNSTVPRDR